MTIEEILWEAIEPHVFTARAAFLRDLKTWKIEPVTVDGDLAHIVLTRGSELHFLGVGQTRPISMKAIRARIEPLLAEHGEVRTRTPKDADRQRRFNEKIGFTPVGEDEYFVMYRMTEMKRGVAQCQL